jgi:hypothetical protein
MPLKFRAPQEKALVKTSPPRRDNPEQSKLFIEKAREIEADQKNSAADKLMGRLVKMKPEPRKKATKG